MTNKDYDLALKYVGIDSNQSDYYSVLKSLEKDLVRISAIKKISREFEAKKVGEYYNLPQLGLTLKSKDIVKMFDNCDSMLFVALTLGMDIDKKIDCLQQTNVTDAMFFDALANVYVENMLNQYVLEIRQQYYKDRYFTLSFSCGYGDLSIAYQQDFLQAVDAQKRVGIYMNDSFLLRPLKTITALIGISNIPQKTYQRCYYCTRKKCNKMCEGDL